MEGNHGWSFVAIMAYHEKPDNNPCLSLNMGRLVEMSVGCPYCGERIDVLLDNSVPQQDYIEDCQVCCRPINFEVTVGHDNEVAVYLKNDED